MSPRASIHIRRCPKPSWKALNWPSAERRTSREYGNASNSVGSPRCLGHNARTMKDMPHIVVVGSCNIDLSFRVERLPQPGETLGGTDFQLGYGGKGANQAIMAARLGARVTMIGRVGRDSFGEDTLTNFRAEGI